MKTLSGGSTIRDASPIARGVWREDDEAFLEYLAENCYHLHYAPSPRAQPFSFGIGNSGASRSIGQAARCRHVFIVPLRR
jgi:hypothetical protein